MRLSGKLLHRNFKVDPMQLSGGTGGKDMLSPDWGDRERSERREGLKPELYFRLKRFGKSIFPSRGVTGRFSGRHRGHPAPLRSDSDSPYGSFACLSTRLTCKSTAVFN